MFLKENIKELRTHQCLLSLKNNFKLLLDAMKQSGLINKLKYVDIVEKKNIK